MDSYHTVEEEFPETATLVLSQSDSYTANQQSHDESSNPAISSITSSRGVFVNRFLVLVALAVCTAISLYYQTVTQDLQIQLDQERDAVTALQATVDGNSQVINRFNSSITNTDVLERLKALEIDLTSAKDELEHELHKVQTTVDKELNMTLQQLSDTVDKAEKEISSEVEKVKTDVEQYVLTTQDQFSMENSFMVYQLAGTFTLLSCLISMWHMTAHLRRMNQPDAQRRILSILWMSPIYAVTSWFSLVFHSASGYLAIIKDGYEAYIIYQFLGFCIAVLGKGDRNTVVDLLAHHAEHLTPPFRLFGCFEICGCCVPDPFENNRALADAILLQCQLFAMQFVFFRPLTTTAMVVLEKMQYYGGGDGPTDYRAPQFYIAIVQNLSIFIAFAGLLKFYHAVDKDLAWCRPFAKFLCIKGVVFMTFWQGLAISVLAQTTDLGGGANGDSEKWAASAQNFLICLEMLLFSIAHFYCFPTDEWEEGYRVKHSQGQFGDSIALGDFFSDLKLILKSNGRKKQKKPKHPALLEGDEMEDDDTDVLSTTTSELADDERLVAKAVGKSLGEDGDDDDPAVAAAKKRLRANELLMSPGDLTSYENARGSHDSGDISPVESDEGDIEHGSNGNGRQERSWSGYSIMGGPASERNEVPTESTGLLASTDRGTSFLEVLRPSIFTTVASIAEIERHTEGQATVEQDDTEQQEDEQDKEHHAESL